MVTRAVKGGDITICRLLGGFSTTRSQPPVKSYGSILTNTDLIAGELAVFDERSIKEVGI